MITRPHKQATAATGKKRKEHGRAGGNVAASPSWNPRYGARSYNAHEIHSLKYAQIESAGKITLNADVRARLVSAVNWYYSDTAFLVDAPVSETVRRKIKGLEKHAHGLAEWLGARNNVDRAILDRAWPPDWNMMNALALQGVLRKIALNLQFTSDTIAAPRGRPRDDPRRALVAKLYAIYRTSGGKGVGVYWNQHKNTHAGPFLNLCYEVFSQDKGECPNISPDGIGVLALEIARRGQKSARSA